jgi:tetratricopeptide (TPR) repeat protein
MLVTGFAACVAAQVAAAQMDHAHSPGAADSTAVPLYTTLGTYHAPITVATPTAQAYFDQGIRLLYAFNHAESERAFLEGERLDPGCAMCAWGAALALGPNINAPMDSAAAVRARAAIDRALAAAGGVTAREVAYIQALAKRYGTKPVADRAGLDTAYAQAMQEVATRFPEDPDAQVLYADALMNLSPWNYWTRDGEPRPATPAILASLEGVLDRMPDPPGACHLFIHAVEANIPERAVTCAERLASLMPGAGHIVHMPGHVYIRVGRYADAIQANRHAVHADEEYLEGPIVTRHGIYPQGYYPHNYHFMSFAASMAGNRRTAVMASRKVVETVSYDVARAVPWLEAITPIVYQTLVTFGRWDEILEEPVPPSDLRYTTGIAYYARGVAFAARGRWAEARAALDTVQAAYRVIPEGDNRLSLAIAGHSLRAEIALRQGLAADAVREFQAAADIEDGMVYTEPPTWFYPVRHSLGKALLAAGRPAEAEQAYREDLERFPDNGWSLFGLAQSLEVQGRRAAAAEARQRFAEAWRVGDVKLVGSRF